MLRSNFQPQFKIGSLELNVDLREPIEIDNCSTVPVPVLKSMIERAMTLVQTLVVRSNVYRLRSLIAETTANAVGPCINREVSRVLVPQRNAPQPPQHSSSLLMVDSPSSSGEFRSITPSHTEQCKSSDRRPGEGQGPPPGHYSRLLMLSQATPIAYRP